MFFSLSSLAVAVLVTAVVGGVTAAGVAHAKSSRRFLRSTSNLGPSSMTQVVPSSFSRNTLPL